MEAVVWTAMRRKPESTLTEDNPNNQGSPRPAERSTTASNVRGTCACVASEHGPRRFPLGRNAQASPMERQESLAVRR